MKSFYVYILTNHSNTVLYTGVTNDIARRTFEHRQKFNDGFAEKYNAYKLVYVEECGRHTDAIEREKQIKKWRREKKVALINSINPSWEDLFKV
ncbi:GIY-YIG nuclease family protein [Anaerocaecibacter muris]|uniref:GIY-YIG nuclease family protein n=1 Tax=Anaerocaecibacter muris TaxID=2941513 RepID=UPI00203C0E81|nr:GIY-YIG nuclease family protein [Anaerocaecibacter muris]